MATQITTATLQNSATWVHMTAEQLSEQELFNAVLAYLRQNGAPLPEIISDQNPNDGSGMVYLRFTNRQTGAYTTMMAFDIVLSPWTTLATLKHMEIASGGDGYVPAFVPPSHAVPPSIPPAPQGKALAVGNLIPFTDNHYANAGYLIPKTGDRVTDDPRGVFVATAYNTIGSAVGCFWSPEPVAAPVPPSANPFAGLTKDQLLAMFVQAFGSAK